MTAERHEFVTGAGVAGVNEFTHGKMLLSEAWTTPRESKTRGTQVLHCGRKCTGAVSGDFPAAASAMIGVALGC